MEETGGLLLSRECHRSTGKGGRSVGVENQFSTIILKSESGSHYQSAESKGKFG